MRTVKTGAYKKFFKRFLDILLAFLAILVLLPLLLLLALLVRLKLGAPVIFKQSRPGLEGRSFTIYKFRTMTERKDEAGRLLPDADRLTGFGNILRSSSLDELPELFNILKGDMSIVGPRPLLEQYLPLYDNTQKRRHEVRPGLTGLAQVSGRNALSWEDRFKLDVGYVDHITFRGDIRIILITIKRVFRRQGIHSETAATMEAFQGDSKITAGTAGPRDRLLIIGAGGHGKVAADIAGRMKRYKHIAFLDDNASLGRVMNIEVIGRSKEAVRYLKDYDIFVAVGSNTVREKITEELEEAGAGIAVLIHPDAVLGEQVTVGTGTVVMAGAVINCCTSIGRGCIINTGATVDHDNVIGDYVHISPGVHTAGTVTVGKGSWLGIGSIIKNNIRITGGCTIGAGAVVVKDIMEAGTYAGVPAGRMISAKSL
jgi:sugar O-acyltransferase (sialic acid O-acetyltransferase NeuD family)